MFLLSIELDLLLVSLLILFWWSDLCNANNAAVVPQTWNALKQRMKSCFVPPYYQHDLRLKL
jgi:hypothetical protein